MNIIDEPLFGAANERPSEASIKPAPEDAIRDLVDGQPYAVLCVQAERQPYGALVAFSFTEDLRQAVFATPVSTRKFRLLSECDQIALVIDNRPDHPEELMQIEALTVTGRAALLHRGGKFDYWADLLVARHPYLEAFTRAQSCALFRVDVIRFFHVTRFQEVQQWIPNDRS